MMTNDGSMIRDAGVVNVSAGIVTYGVGDMKGNAGVKKKFNPPEARSAGDEMERRFGWKGLSKL